MNIKFIIMMSFNVNVFSPFVYIVEENGQNAAKNFAFFSFF